MSAHMMLYVFVVPVLVLMVWRRVARQFGRQPVRRKRMMVRIGILAVALAFLSAMGIHNPHLLEGLLAGVVGGAIIAFVGLRLTRFEADPVKGDCYVPNVWIGALLTAILLGRLAYRFLVVMPEVEQTAVHTGTTPIHTYSPLTMAVIGLLLGYYLIYYIGLLIHHRRFLANQPAAEAAGES